MTGADAARPPYDVGVHVSVSTNGICCFGVAFVGNYREQLMPWNFKA